MTTRDVIFTVATCVLAFLLLISLGMNAILYLSAVSAEQRYTEALEQRKKDLEAHLRLAERHERLLKLYRSR